ncbi:MAG: GTPase domain-containing protein [Holophagae bacterium]|nr:GTPase domain-containing protein [Holophagae bacterium]
MVNFNYTSREVTVKIVYYGPGLCGKTTSLQHIYKHIPRSKKGKMVSLATQTDRTLFFDFLPIELGQIKGLNTKIQLYTVPGQVFYDATRKLVLKGADGIVFVADSQKDMLQANIDSFGNLISNLRMLGFELEELPHVIQYNKRDLDNILGVKSLNKEVNQFNVPHFETSAITGEGVVETLREIARIVLLNISEKYHVELDELAAEEILSQQGDEPISEIDDMDVQDADDSISLSDLPYPDSFSTDLEELQGNELSNSYEVQLLEESVDSSNTEVEELSADSEIKDEKQAPELSVDDGIQAFPGTPIRIDRYHYSLPITIEVPRNVDLKTMRFTVDINFREKM